MVSVCAAVARAVDGVRESLAAGHGLVVVQGARGSGKTTVCRTLTQILDGDSTVVIDDADRQEDLASHIERAGKAASAMVLALTEPGPVAEVDLRPAWVILDELSMPDVEELVSRAGFRSAPPDAVRCVHQLTGGNLRTTVELLARLPADAFAAWDRLGPDDLRELPVTKQARLDVARFPLRTRMGLCLAAHADDEPMRTIELALAACDLGLEDMAPAETAFLIDLDRRGVRFARPVDRIAAAESLPLAERQRLIRCLALASRDGSLDRSAWFDAMLSDPPQDALADRLADLAATEQARRHSMRAAVTWQRAHLFRSAPDGRDLVRAARCVLDDGEFELAGRLAARARTESAPPKVRSAADRIDLLVATWSGRPSADVAAPDVPIAGAAIETAALLLQATVAAMHAGRLDRAVGLATRASEVAAGLGPLGTAARAIAGYATSLRGDPDGRRSLDEARTLHVDLAPTAERDPAVLHLTSWVGRILAEGGHPAAAAEMLGWTIRTADQLGSKGFAIMPIAHRALLRLRYHGPRSAADDVERLRTLVDEFGLHEHRVTADLVRGRAEALAGNVAAVPRLREVASRSAGPAEAEAYLALGVASLARGDNDTALEWLQRVAQRCATVGLAHPGFLPYEAELVEALVRCGKSLDAAELADQHRKVAAGWGDPFVTALAERSIGLTSDDPDTSEVHLLRSIELLDDLGAPLESARSMLCLGEQRRRARRRAAAREPLRSAQLTFERLGATAWSARCADELRAAGGEHGGSLDSGVLAALTERERRIAELAASGATNREIAAALYVSPKTVENQLSRIYAKVRVRSRTELARMLDRSG